MEPPVRLRVAPPKGEPFEHLLESDELVVGRSNEADLALPDRYLSRRHARFVRRGATLLVEDLGSRNGTLVNGEPIAGPCELRLGDRVTLSGTTITFGGRNAGTGAPGRTLFFSPSDLLDGGAEVSAHELGDEAGLRRYAERLRLLHEVHRALGSSMELPSLLELILDRAFEHLRPEQGAIFLRGAGGRLTQAASRDRRGGSPRVACPRTLIEEVAGKGLAALVHDVHSDERFAGAESMRISGLRSLLAAPLLAPEGSLGMMVLSSRLAVRHFTQEDMELLVSLASVAALQLRNVELAEEAAERRVLEQELALARHIQMALLPSALPQVPGYRLHGTSRPSRTVSGDSFQALTRSTGDCVLMVTDVSGKGMGAALLPPLSRPWPPVRSRTGWRRSRSSPGCRHTCSGAPRPRSTPRLSWRRSTSSPAVRHRPTTSPWWRCGASRTEIRRASGALLRSCADPRRPTPCPRPGSRASARRGPARRSAG